MRVGMRRPAVPGRGCGRRGDGGRGPHSNVGIDASAAIGQIGSQARPRADRHCVEHVVPPRLVRSRAGPSTAGKRPVRDAAAVAGRSAARSRRWRRSAASRPGRRRNGSTPGWTTCCATAAAPTTWPSGSPASTSAPRTGRSSCTAAGASSPGSATRSWRTAPTTRSSAT